MDHDVRELCQGSKEEGFEHIAKLFEGVAEIEKIMSSAIMICLKTSRRVKYSSKKPKWYGSAETAATEFTPKKLPKFAMCALIPKRILKCT